MGNFFKSPSSFSTFSLEEKLYCLIMTGIKTTEEVSNCWVGEEIHERVQRTGVFLWVSTETQAHLFVALLYLTFVSLLQVMCSAREL